MTFEHTTQEDALAHVNQVMAEHKQALVDSGISPCMAEIICQATLDRVLESMYHDIQASQSDCLNKTDTSQERD